MLFSIIDIFANVLFWSVYSMIHFSYTILCSFILYCIKTIYLFVYGSFHILSILIFNSISYYLLLCALIMLILSVCADIVNRHRYKKFCSMIKKKYNKISFSDTDDRLIKYSSFIKKHVENDQFLSIFKSYYPYSGVNDTMNKIKLHNVIKKYMYNTDPSDIINYSQYVSDPQISTIRTINQLTSKYEKMYIFDQSDNTDNNIIFVWNNLDDVIFYQNSFSIITNHFKYLNFAKIMRSHDFGFNDITPNVRTWVHSSLNQKSNEFKIINFVFLSSEQVQLIGKFEIIPTKNCIYIEIKGFTHYCSLFDMITFDTFNEYSNLKSITRSLNKLFNEFVMTDIHIYASDITTMIVPFITNYYQERIHTIHVKDPMFYPYNFQTFFVNLRKYDELKLSIGCQYNLIGLLNNISLIEMYIDPDMCDKNENMLYGSNTIVSFSDQSHNFVDKNNLIMLLSLYSNVVIEGN